MNNVKSYALKNYPKFFKKKRVVRDGKGKLINVTYTDIDPIIVDGGSHWRVSNNIDGSPIILSKDI